MSGRLAGGHVFVTGASRGIGASPTGSSLKPQKDRGAARAAQAGR